jgi:glycosyltransferase involved in cell wall biosynthesis
MRIAFITTFCSHYRVKTFETLSKYHAVDYYFFSAGDDWYWEQKNGVYTGNFRFEYLKGISLGRIRVNPDLPLKLLRGNYDAYIKCINGRFVLPLTYLIARIRRKPFILWTGIWMRLQTPAHRLLFPLTRYLYRHADAIVVYGEHVKRYLLEEGVSEERIFVTTHAVDNDAYNRPVLEDEKRALLQQLNIPQEAKVILYLGRLVDSKGLSILLEAFASLDQEDAILLFAGDGDYRAQLEELAAAKNISKKIRFAGYVPTHQTVLYYALAYVCVLPSITTNTFKEPWGLVVNEAFNQGVPVIATDAVGAAAGGLVQDGVNGFVVQERDIIQTASALQKILDDPFLRDDLGENARKIIDGWDNESMVSGFRRAIDYVFRKKTHNQKHT